MAECEEKSNTMEVEDDDLEDGEIEDDEDDVVVIETKPVEPPPKPKDHQKDDHHHSSSSKSTSNDKKTSSNSRKRANAHDNDDDEEDIASSIANAIAENLKRKGIEPPMPNVKKADSETEQTNKKSSSKGESKSARKRRRRRERMEKEKQQEKDENPNARKRSKITEDDGFYMVGGSPPHDDASDNESDSSGSSYDSDELNRLSYEERRALRREKRGGRGGGAVREQRERSRSRSRERERRRREREKRRRSRSRSRSRSRDRRRDRERDSEKEVCLRYAEHGHCPDDDCQRSHDVRQPKKMELCKFWLMECCAKREKCSYMHGDFPCKYYYLGLKCINRDCKFKHGKPLEDNIKQILLKHLDTAPKEILGDFPRIGRENATKMMAQTHIKLCQEFNIPCPEAEKSKIPSLLDISIQPPENLKGGKTKNRWGANESRSSPSNDKASTSSADIISPGDVVLANLKEILSEKQIDSMAAIGVITVSQINNLTVAQLNELGLSFATIGEIQAKAIHIGNQHSGKTSDEAKVEEDNKEILTEPVENMKSDLKDKLPLDVDMRLISATETANISETIKSPSSSIMSPTQSDAEEIYKKPEIPLTKSSPVNVLMSPPSGTLDLSQYLRDSNLNNDDEEDNDTLKIDENYYTSDHEQDDKKDSQSEDDQQTSDELTSKPFDLLPPSFDSINFLKATTTKIDISSSVSQLMEMESPKPVIETSTSTITRDPRMRGDPRKPPGLTAKESPVAIEISSPTYRDPRQQKIEPPRRASIYEIESPSEEEDIINIDKDKDMRFLNSENGDIDLRFPFTPMANFVPATEIEASYGIHIFDTFEVKVIDVPKVDYSDIRKSFRHLENTQDPRLKKLFGIGEAKQQQQDSPNSLKSSLFSSNSSAPSDPRKRRAQEQEGPKKLQISTILQNSKHYNELSSSQKMVVNEVLAELTKELKAFHANPSPSKIFDNSFITQRPKLQQVLIGLGVFVNNDGDFEEIKDVPNITMMTMPKMQIPPPIAIPNLTSLPISLSQPPPMLRPGLLGFAPPSLPFAANIIEPTDLNFPALNQMAFDQFSNRVGGNNNNNNNNNNNSRSTRDQRHNSNFRNNNNSNRNNYRNRRN